MPTLNQQQQISANSQEGAEIGGIFLLKCPFRKAYNLTDLHKVPEKSAQGQSKWLCHPEPLVTVCTVDIRYRCTDCFMIECRQSKTTGIPRVLITDNLP